VAPVLLDAAYDTSLRDLRANWRPVFSLVLFAVGLTTAVVACVARFIFPEMPWGAAIALGALLAPPDAVAALAVLRTVDPPHRLRKILEGESLLNDASALLIYKLAVGAVAAGGFSAASAAPTFAAVVIGSAIVGWLLARPVNWLINQVDHAPTSVILQFVNTFGIWLLAEHLGLSAVVTIVVFGITIARGRGGDLPAKLRVPSFAIWETVTFVLNALAFLLVGLQIRPIFGSLAPAERWSFGMAALVMLVVVVAVRLVWVMIYAASEGRAVAHPGENPKSPVLDAKGGLVIGWSGMRGIVTLAAAMALPTDFPYRDFIQLTAFIVVLGTLVIQGLTLKPLIAALRIPRDDGVDHEVTLARRKALKAVLAGFEDDPSPAAARVREEYSDVLSRVKDGENPSDMPHNALRRRAVGDARRAIAELRRSGEIGDDAYRQVEAELDLLELSTHAT
jgi:CPA1 family monovalent cation:H+ antiporter